MIRALGIASTGVLGQETNVNTIAQNLANLRTPGYKRVRAEFTDLLYQTIRGAGVNSADDGTIAAASNQQGLGVRVRSILRTHNQGPLEQTDDPLSVAIQGEGFLQVALPTGETAYTRAGNFRLSETGEIVTADGFTVEPAITIPDDATSISINSSGEVIASIQGQTDAQNLGQLELARFLNSSGLEATGNNLYLETAASGPPTTGNAAVDGFGTIIQGFIETANVNAVTEITSLIAAQRAYELNTRVISASDEMLQSLNQTA